MPDHVTDLLDEQRILGELEGVGRPGLEPEGLPDPGDRRLAHARGLGHVPVDQWVASFGFSVSVFTTSASISSSPNLRGHARSGLVVQTVETRQLAKRRRHFLTVATSTPRRSATSAVAKPLGAGKHDPTPKGERLLALGPPRPRSSVARSSSLSTTSTVRVHVVPSLPPIVADNGRNARDEGEIP